VESFASIGNLLVFFSLHHSFIALNEDKIWHCFRSLKIQTVQAAQDLSIVQTWHHHPVEAFISAQGKFKNLNKGSL
jgi:hypothetical protein